MQDDLFRHVNGTWLAKTEIPADRSSWGSFDRLRGQIAERPAGHRGGRCEGRPTRRPGSDAQKIGDFYDSFMNEAKVEELGLEPIEAELAAIDAIKTKEDLARHFARFFKLNLINPVTGYVDGDAREPGRDILYLYQGGLGLPDRDYYLQNDPKLREYREKYVLFLENILKLGGQSSAGASAREIFTLETRLARSHWTNVESRDAVKTYNKVAIGRSRQGVPRLRLGRVDQELGLERRRRRSSSTNRAT